MPKKVAAPAAPINIAPPEPEIIEEVPIPEESPEEREARTCLLVLEDFVVTQLLSKGRSLRNNDLTAAAEGFALSRNGLKEGLERSPLVQPLDRDWELALRTRGKGLSREERSRTPLETALRAFLDEVGKPLPLAVIVREMAVLRGAYPENIRDSISHVLKSSRWAIEVRDNTFSLESLVLDAGAPREDLVIRENQLELDPDFHAVQEMSIPDTKGDLAQRAATVLESVGRPLSQKVLGFLLYRQNPQFDGRALAVALGDRSKFYSFTHGFVATQKQMPVLYALLDNWLQSIGGVAAANIDVAQLLRQRLAPNQVLAPTPEQLEEALTFAKGSQGAFSLATVLTDTLEIEPDDERFVPLLQGFNDALRRSPEYLSAGIGQFLLRASVPSYVGEVPEVLRPVHLSVRSTETHEPLDIEMSDEGLEHESMVDFVHDPRWEDVNEEVEVRLPRRTGEIPASTQYVILNHHLRAGTMKLRRMDEEFFSLQGALARVPVRAVDGGKSEQLTVWSSKESGLLYGLGDWFQARLPQSGGVLIFSRDPNAGLNTPIEVTIGAPDKLMSLDEDRVHELEALREPSAYLSLFELLQSVLSKHGEGVELPTVWAEINTIRRTSKRLLCSVLSGYHCYYFKQRGPKQFLWRYDAGKTDQGFKRNKRKFVRR